jgi:hypothetical protein
MAETVANTQPDTDEKAQAAEGAAKQTHLTVLLSLFKHQGEAI